MLCEAVLSVPVSTPVFMKRDLGCSHVRVIIEARQPASIDAGREIEEYVSKAVGFAR